MNHVHKMTLTVADLPWTTVCGIAGAFLLGAFVVIGVGLASPDVIHNAAHDLRHTLAFPCH